MMKSLLIVTLGLLISITACAPAPEIIATTMAQTAATLSTDTPLPHPTATFTFTPIPPTNTPTLTPTNTPDLQVITTDPEDIVCATRDLPGGGDYIQGQFDKYFGLQQVRPDEYFGSPGRHFTNNLVIRSKGAYHKDLMEEYVSRTERIDGWWLDFKKTNDGYSGFIYLQCIVTKFQAVTGAQLAVQKYNDVENYGEPYKYLNPDQSIGDVSIAISRIYSYYDMYLNSTNTRVFYEVDFSYRNYRVTIIGHGEAELDDLYYVGERVLKKLERAPLSAP